MLRFGLLLMLLAAPVLGQSTPANCPEFYVTGPQGIPDPDEPIVFEATIAGPLPKNVKYRWTVTGGEILDGHEGKKIRVLFDKNSGITLSASFEIIGLPKGCPTTASESAPTWCPTPPILIDEFPTELSSIQEEKFLLAAEEQKNNPDDQLYIIEYFPNGTSQFDIRERHRKLREILVKKGGLKESSFVFTIAKSEELITRIYRIPPGATPPEP